MKFNEMHISGTYVGLTVEPLQTPTATGATRKFLIEVMYNPNQPNVILETLNEDMLKAAKSDGVAKGVSVVCVCRLITNKGKDGRTWAKTYPYRLTTLLKYQEEQATLAPATALQSLSTAATDMAIAMHQIPAQQPTVPSIHIANDDDLPF